MPNLTPFRAWSVGEPPRIVYTDFEQAQAMSAHWDNGEEIREVLVLDASAAEVLREYAEANRQSWFSLGRSNEAEAIVRRTRAHHALLALAASIPKRGAE